MKGLTTILSHPARNQNLQLPFRNPAKYRRKGKLQLPLTIHTVTIAGDLKGVWFD
jgi:hypothetical protein